MFDHFPQGVFYVFSTITYTAAIASIIGSMCFSQPALDTSPSVDLVYKVGHTPKKEYYRPVYIVDNSNKSETKSLVLQPVLLTDVYQTR